MKNIAIIPARSGSKGLKDKNIKELCKMPLIAWSIKAALEADCFDEIMVSTDSEKYADIAREYGARVPFLRSSENASDTAGSWDVCREVINGYKKLGRDFDTICLLQPTSPLRSGEDITGAYKLFDDKNADAVVSVCELEHGIDNINSLPANLCLDGFCDSRKSGRRQDYETYYRINGAVYIQKVPALMKCENVYGANSYAYVMDKRRSIDIDDELDFVQAEAVLRYYKNERMQAE